MELIDNSVDLIATNLQLSFQGVFEHEDTDYISIRIHKPKFKGVPLSEFDGLNLAVINLMYASDEYKPSIRFMSIYLSQFDRGIYTLSVNGVKYDSIDLTKLDTYSEEKVIETAMQIQNLALESIIRYTKYVHNLEFKISGNWIIADDEIDFIRLIKGRLETSSSLNDTTISRLIKNDIERLNDMITENLLIQIID